MTMEQDLNDVLYERMSKEYELFMNKLILQSPEDIIRASYEKVFKEDILMVVESGELDAKYVKALLKEQYPLDGCYQRWLKEDVSYMEDLRFSIENHAKSLMAVRKEDRSSVR